MEEEEEDCDEVARLRKEAHHFQLNRPGTT